MPHGEGFIELGAPNTLSACTTLALGDASTGSKRDAEKIIKKLKTSWGRASSRWPERMFVETGRGSGSLMLAPVGVTQQERYGCCEFQKKTKTL